jgi:putative transposase
MLVGLLALARASIELAESEVAVGHERAHAAGHSATASVLYAHELRLVPITTPAYSPQSDGLTEAFVKTFKRDYVDGAKLRTPKPCPHSSAFGSRTTTRAPPHSALGMRSPAEYRAGVTLSSSR